MVSARGCLFHTTFLDSRTLSLVDSPEPEPVHATPITMKMTTPLGPPPHRPLNPIPRSEEHYRPCRQLLIFGNGDMGQLGLGTLVLDVITRPRMHAWFESVSQGDLLGTEVGAGVECVCTGGMHSLVIDELGRVRVVFYVILF